MRPSLLRCWFLRESRVTLQSTVRFVRRLSNFNWTCDTVPRTFRRGETSTFKRWHQYNDDSAPFGGKLGTTKRFALFPCGALEFPFSPPLPQRVTLELSRLQLSETHQAFLSELVPLGRPNLHPALVS